MMFELKIADVGDRERVASILVENGYTVKAETWDRLNEYGVQDDREGTERVLVVEKKE